MTPIVSQLCVFTMALSAAATVAVRAAPAVHPPPAPAAASPTALPSPATTASMPSSANPAAANQLDEVIVRGKRDLLGESDAKMKKLKESLPDINSDDGHKDSFAQKVVDRTKEYLNNHKDPNKINDDGKALIERAQNGVDATQNANKATIAQPDAKDYVDPLCQTGSCPP